MTSGIYCIQNVISGKRYIGSAINVSSRWRIHKYVLGKSKHHSQYLQHAWKKYGASVFEWTILEECSPEMLTIREQVWMDYYQSYERELGYNICSVAGSLLGTKRSLESRKKMSETAKMRVHLPCSEETKRKISIANKGDNHIRGRVCSAETRKKISLSNLGRTKNIGRPVSEETRKRISLSNVGKKRSEQTKMKLKEAWKRRKDRVPASSGRQIENSQVG